MTELAITAPTSGNGDEEAIERARQFVDGHDVELWEHARKVAAFKHKGEKSNRSIIHEFHDA